MTGRLELRFLGGAVECVVDGADVSVHGAGLQALVALLALSAPKPAPMGRLIDELWGDEQPMNPENALQAKVSHLRRLLGRASVVRQDAGYALAVDPDDIDVMRVERLVRDGRRAASAGDHQQAATTFEAALGVVSGDAFSDLANYRFAVVASSRVQEFTLAAHEGLADARLALGCHLDAVSPLRDLAREHPFRERFHAQLMLALYRSGRQADALAAFRHARQLLTEELGLEPSSELRALEHAVLTHDPSLTSGLSFLPPMPDATVLPGARSIAEWRDEATGASAVIRLPFVGRGGVMRELRSFLTATSAGNGGIVLLEGEPGVGKTRLAEELASRATADGVTVVWSRCYAGSGAPAFWPWTQVLHKLGSTVDPHELRVAIRNDAPELVQIAPELKDLVGAVDPPPPLDPEAARFRVCQAATDTLVRLGRQRTVIIVLDDVHWADAGSMELLGRLAAECGDTRVGVVATYRTVDPTAGSALSSLLAEVARHRHAQRLGIRGLDRAELAQFLSASGVESSEELVATLDERTGGNPFFVTEIIRPFPGEAGSPDARRIQSFLPATVKGVLRRRVDQLPDETGRTLTAAAVLGHDFELSMLSAITELDGAALLEHLEPAVAAGLLVDSHEGRGGRRFSHGLVQEALYEEMGAARRARLHHRAAEAREARSGDADGPHLLTTAEHWYRAVPVAPAGSGVTAARRAAMWALGHVAHRQAEDQLHAALELVAMLPVGRERAEIELGILDELGMVLIVNTSYTGEEIAVVAARTRELCDQIDDQARVIPALWRLATHHLMRGELDAGIAVGHELVERGSGRNDLTPAVLAGHMCLGMLLTHRGVILAARQHLDEAIEMCDAGHGASLVGLVVEEPAVFSRVFSAINWVLLGDDGPGERDAQDAVAIGCRDGPDSYSTAIALWGASMTSLLRRDVPTTVQRSTAALEQATRFGYPLGMHSNGVNLGWALAMTGEVESGINLIREHSEACYALGAVDTKHFYLALLAEASVLAGRLDDAHAAIESALSVVASTGESWYSAELHRLRGEAFVAADASDPRAAGSFSEARRVATAQGAHGLLGRVDESLTRLARRGGPRDR